MLDNMLKEFKQILLFRSYWFVYYAKSYETDNQNFNHNVKM